MGSNSFSKRTDFGDITYDVGMLRKKTGDFGFHSDSSSFNVH